MRVSRKQRKHLRSVDAADTRARNRGRKSKERQRRDERMLKELKARRLRYSPAVTSWLCRKLDKPAGRITEKDLRSLLK